MRFYEISTNLATQYYEGALEPWPDLEELFLGPSIPEGLHLKVYKGTKPADILTGLGWVVSRRFIDALAGCGATGYRAFPFEVRRNGEVIPGYFGLKILGRGGPLDEERSGVYRHRNRPGGAIFGHRAIYMFEDQWDGSDVFAIPGMGVRLFVTERVQQALKKAKLVNLKMTLNSECKFGSQSPPVEKDCDSELGSGEGPMQDNPLAAEHTFTLKQWLSALKERLPRDLSPYPEEMVPKKLLEPFTAEEIRRLTGRLLSDLTDSMALREIALRQAGSGGRQASQDRVKQVLGVMPILLDLLGKALLARLRDAAEILAITYEIHQVCGKYIPPLSGSWMVLAGGACGMLVGLMRDGLDDAAVETAVENARARVREQLMSTA